MNHKHIDKSGKTGLIKSELQPYPVEIATAKHDYHGDDYVMSISEAGFAGVFDGVTNSRGNRLTQGEASGRAAAYTLASLFSACLGENDFEAIDLKKLKDFGSIFVNNDTQLKNSEVGAISKYLKTQREVFLKMIQRVQELFIVLDNDFVLSSQADGRKFGESTMLIAKLLKEGFLILGWLGDSEAYLSLPLGNDIEFKSAENTENGLYAVVKPSLPQLTPKLVPLTISHNKLVDFAKKELPQTDITPDLLLKLQTYVTLFRAGQLRTIPNKYLKIIEKFTPESQVVTRCIKPTKSVDPSYAIVGYIPTGSILMLATDGITDCLTNEAINVILTKARLNQISLQQGAKELVTAANSATGNLQKDDDRSVVLMRII